MTNQQSQEIKITDNIPGAEYTNLAQINHNKDFRNYKVSCDKAARVLGYVPKDDAGAIVDNLFANYEKFKDFENPEYYNIQIFKNIKDQMAV